MPWQETCAMTKRMRFVAAGAAGEESIAVLCRRPDISRKTGYTWLGRYQTAGVGGSTWACRLNALTLACRH